MSDVDSSLRSQATLQEWKFESRLPIFGVLITKMRRWIHGLAGRWALAFALQQQSDFNHALLDLIAQQQSDFNHALLEQSRRLQAENQSLLRDSDRLLNLERQSIETERTLLDTRRDLTELRLIVGHREDFLIERVDALGESLDGLRHADVAIGSLLDALQPQVAESLEHSLQQARQIALTLNESNNGIQARLAKVQEQVEGAERDLAALRDNDQDLAALVAGLRREQRLDQAPVSDAVDRRSFTPAPSADVREALDYFLFEMRYRGRPEDIMRRQEVYLPFFQTSGVVVDLGCGRGEFVRLLTQRGITARGVDLDPDMVNYCRQSGLPVELADAIEYLANIDDNSLGGVFLGQVIEHLPPAVLGHLIHLAYQKLKPDAYFVAETINPICLYALVNNYLLDVSHVRPVHPETLCFMLRGAGFQDVKTQYASPVPEVAKLRRFPWPDEQTVGEREWLPILNANVDRLNEFLYGNQDYAAIGRKFPWPTRFGKMDAHLLLAET